MSNFYVEYSLDPDRDEYVVRNGDDRELYADSSESDVIRFCENLKCSTCGDTGEVEGTSTLGPNQCPDCNEPDTSSPDGITGASPLSRTEATDA